MDAKLNDALAAAIEALTAAIKGGDYSAAEILAVVVSQLKHATRS